MKQQSATASLALVFLIFFALACFCGDRDKRTGDLTPSINSSNSGPIFSSNSRSNSSKNPTNSANSADADDSDSPTQAGDVKVKEIFLAKDDGTGQKYGERTDSFSTDDKLIHCVAMFDGGAPAGTNLRADLYYVKTNQKAASVPYSAAQKLRSMDFFVEAPDSGWKAGTYRFDIFINGTKVGSETFEME